MDRTNSEVELFDLVDDGVYDATLRELSDMQLALIGGGHGEVVFG